MTERVVWRISAVVALLSFGCAPGPDSSQYKTYEQLQAHQTGGDRLAAGSESDTADAEAPLDPAFAPDHETSSQLADSENRPATPVEATPGAATSTETAAPLTAPTMKVVNGKVVVQTLPGGVRLLVPQASFRTEGPQGALRINYDDLDLLRILNMEPVTEDAVSYFPDWLKSLNGKKVRIRGFMVPGFEAKGLTQFVLARDTSACCFGPQAKLYYLIIVQLQPGKTTDYIPNSAFDVVGTFRIDMLADQGVPIGLYWIDDAQIIER